MWPAELFFKGNNVQDGRIFLTTAVGDLPDILLWNYEGLHSVNFSRSIMENFPTVWCNSFVLNKGKKTYSVVLNYVYKAIILLFDFTVLPLHIYCLLLFLTW